MKKLMIALATFLTVATTQAQTGSGPTLYGVIDVGVGTWSTTAQKSNGTVTNTNGYSLYNGGLGGNRLGVKGSEKLNNGLETIYVTEWSVNAVTDGAFTKYDGQGSAAGNKTAEGTVAAPFNRQTWVGLKGSNFGEARIGYQHNIQYDHNVPYTAGYEGNTGARNHFDMYAPVFYGNVMTNYESARLAGITYFSPVIENFQILAQTGKQTSAQQNGTQASTITNYELKQNSFGFAYNNGPISASAIHGDARGRSATNALLSTANEIKSNGTVYGASYNLGVAKLFAYWGNRSASQSGLKDVNVKTNRIGTKVPYGAWTFGYSYGVLTADEASTTVSDRKFTQISALYDFSKRTTAYLIYGKDNDNHSLAGTSAGTVAAWGSGASAGTPTDYKTIRAGLAHRF